MDTEQLDLNFGHEPPLAAPVSRLAAGRRALRRRRYVQGLAGTIGAVALGSATWAVLPGTESNADGSLASDAGPTVLTTLPTAVPDDCVGLVCVELIPHGKRSLGTPWGDMAVGFRDGRLVSFSHDVHVVKAIVDPTGTGATESAVLEVVFRETRFRVALAQDFGYLIDQVDDGPDTSLTAWFSSQHALPEGGGCGVYSSADDPVDRADSPGPGECWIDVDRHGKVVPHAGVTLTRQVTPQVAEGALPRGVQVTAVAFTRNGKDWYGVVRSIGDGAFVSTSLARASDLAPGTTLEAWATKTAPEVSMTGVSDPDYRRSEQPEPWQTLHWWDAKTGEFRTPDGVAVVRHVDNPIGYAAPDDSAGLVFEFRGQRYWALTQKHAAVLPKPGAGGVAVDDVRTSGVTVTRAEGERSDGAFDTWLARAVAEAGRNAEDGS